MICSSTVAGRPSSHCTETRPSASNEPLLTTPVYSTGPVAVHVPQRAWVSGKRIVPSFATSPASVPWLLQGATRSMLPVNCAPSWFGIEVTAQQVCRVTDPSDAIQRWLDCPAGKRSTISSGTRSPSACSGRYSSRWTGRRCATTTRGSNAASPARAEARDGDSTIAPEQSDPQHAASSQVVRSCAYGRCVCLACTTSIPRAGRGKRGRRCGLS